MLKGDTHPKTPHTTQGTYWAAGDSWVAAAGAVTGAGAAGYSNIHQTPACVSSGVQNWERHHRGGSAYLNIRQHSNSAHHTKPNELSISHSRPKSIYCVYWQVAQYKNQCIVYVTCTLHVTMGITLSNTCIYRYQWGHVIQQGTFYEAIRTVHLQKVWYSKGWYSYYTRTMRIVYKLTQDIHYLVVEPYH